MAGESRCSAKTKQNKNRIPFVKSTTQEDALKQKWTLGGI